MAAPASSKLLRFLTILYFAEAGAFLVALSLEPLLDPAHRRPFARGSPAASPLSRIFRSFLVGLGLLHLWVAVRDLEAWRKGRPHAGRRSAGEGVR